MNCKNCQRSLRTDYTFCPNCGARVIRNRITVKNLWYDAVERFFNVDNTFITTFTHLFTKPEAVIGGYISGVRKKYLNPISYFTIAVTMGGLFIFLSQEFFPDAMDFQFQNMETNTERDQIAVDFGKKFQDTLFKFQSFFYILTIPILALISKLVFIDKKQYNFSEHFVINIYGYAQLSICANLVYIFLMWNSKWLFYAGLINFPLQLLYFTFVFKNIFKLKVYQALIRLFFFLVIFGACFAVVSILLGVYLALFTDTFANMAPPKG